MVSSKALPGLSKSLQRDSWIEHLPAPMRAAWHKSWIYRTAKHLHHEKKMPVGRAIAIAVNAAKKGAVSGDLNFRGKQSVNSKSRSEMVAAVALWESMKKARKAKSKTASLSLEDKVRRRLVDLGMPEEKAESVGRELVSNLSESPGYWLVYYENRSTPDVIEDGEKPKQHRGYGKITSRRRPNERQLKSIKEGRWIRVREDGKEPDDPGAKRSSYRPKLAARQKTKK